MAVKKSLKDYEKQVEKDEAILNFFAKVGCFKELPKLNKHEVEEKILSMTMGKRFDNKNKENLKPVQDTMNEDQKSQYI